MLYQVPERPTSPYVGSIAELLGRSAEIQAQRLRDVAAIQAQVESQKGQNRGNTIATIGQLGAQTIGGILGAKQQQKRAAALNQYMASGEPITLGGLILRGASPKEADDVMQTVQRGEAQKHAAVVQDRNYQLEQDKLAFEQKRLAATDAQSAQTRREGLANQLVDELTPGQSLAPPSASTLETGGRADLVKTNPPQAMPPFLQTPETAPDYNPGAQPGKVYQGTAAQNFQRQQAELAAERQRQTDARLDRQTGETNRHDLAMEAAARLRAGTSTDTAGDADAIADAIANGDQPPVMTGLYRLAGPVRAALAKKGYNLTTATLDWQATTKHLTTLNNAQQTRLSQSINALPELLDTVDTLAQQWKGGRFPILNRANLAAAKGGAYGEDVATVARQLDSQIADVVADLGNVYMGGNSPTDHALQLAGKSLSGDWSEKVLRDMVTLARKNVTIRRNSIRNTGVAGASPNNPYAPQSASPNRIYYDSNGNPVKP